MVVRRTSGEVGSYVATTWAVAGLIVRNFVRISSYSRSVAEKAGDFEPLLANLEADGRQRLNVCDAAFSFVRITSAPPTAVISGVFRCEILNLYRLPKKTHRTRKFANQTNTL
jgi:hypothetical protein